VSDRIAIGTRGSALALAQARLVRAALEAEGRTTRIVIIETDGDRRTPDTAWGERAFVAAIESALLDGRVDVAVHSAKDVPIDQDPRLRIAAYLPRADPRDALVVRADATERRLADLKAGTRLGTDSPRRTGFVLAHRPDLVVHPLHGNVDTRLRRLDDGETDALVLACAGLDRLGLGHRIAERLAPDIVPPAPGQGAIALQIRADDGRMLGLTASIGHGRTRIVVEAERAFLETSGGGCRAPIGALATLVGSEIELLAGHASVDGSSTVLARRRAPARNGRDLAVAFALDLLPERGDAIATPPRPRVLVTRPSDQAAELSSALRGFGLEPVVVPAISIETHGADAGLDRAAASLDAYRWIVVTSANGASAVVAAVERANRSHVKAGSANTTWAAIGPATAAVLGDAGIVVGFQPAQGLAGALARELPVEAGERVLVVRGDLADDTLAKQLRARGAAVDDVVGYRTRRAPVASRALLRAAMADGPVAAVVFTSGSAASGLIELGDAEALDVTSMPAVCIGPETARSATSAGFRVVAVAASPDRHALAGAAAAAVSPRPLEAV
jgi:hydroxymethylbilane synthase